MGQKPEDQKDALDDVIEIGAGGEAGSQDGAASRPADQDNRTERALAGVLWELKQTRTELRAVREENRALQASGGGGGGTDRFGDLRGLSEAELDELAGESEADKRRIREFRVVREDERINETVRRSREAEKAERDKERAEQNRQEAERALALLNRLAEANPWIDDPDSTEGELFEVALKKALKAGKSQSEAVAEATKKVAPALKAAGMKLRLVGMDEEFVAKVVGGTRREATTLPPSVGDVPGGIPARGRDAAKLDLNQPNRKLVDALGDMTPAQLEAWAAEED